ncbi:MAG: hypothetical protein WDN09_03135 [bacterium]
MEAETINLFDEEPGEFVLDNETYEVHNWFKPLKLWISGAAEEVKPFIARREFHNSVSERKLTEIGLGIAFKNPESGVITIWSLDDQDLGERSEYYPMFLKAAQFLRGEESFNDHTLVNCFNYANDAVLKKGDGTFSKKSNPFPEAKPARNGRSWLIALGFLVAAFAIWYLFTKLANH